METKFAFEVPGRLQSAETFTALIQLLEQRGEYIAPAKRNEFETQVVSTQGELILTLFETIVAQLDPERIPEFELPIAQKLTESIEALAKQVNGSSNGGWTTISKEWRGLRARAARTERRLDIQVCPQREVFEASVRWAAELGEEQELHLLQQAECKAHGAFEQDDRLIEVAIQRISERGHHLGLQIDTIRGFRQDPIAALRAITLVGLSAAETRKGGLDHQVLNIEGYNPVAALREVLDEAPSPSLRSEAAWAMGQIGGLQIARDLLNRLDAIYVRPETPEGEVAYFQGQPETKAVCATLVQALDQTLDTATRSAFIPRDQQLLRRVYSALLNHLLTLEEPDPDFSTALAMSLAHVGLRVPSDAPENALERLLNAAEPIATLATVGSLRELLSCLRLDGILGYVHDAKPDDTIDAAFDVLGEKRRRPYGREERVSLLDMVAQFWHAHQDMPDTSDCPQETMEAPPPPTGSTVS